MKGKGGLARKFDKVLRGMLTRKPLSRAKISERIQARRKAKRKGEQVSRAKNSRS